jgi:hypothetical protein
LKKFTTKDIIFGVYNYTSIFRKNKKLIKSKLL